MRSNAKGHKNSYKMFCIISWTTKHSERQDTPLYCWLQAAHALRIASSLTCKTRVSKLAQAPRTTSYCRENLNCM